MLIPRRVFGRGLAALLVIGATIVLLSKTVINPVNWVMMALASDREPATPLTTHLVLFQFKETTSQTAIKEVTSKMLALKKNCIHPSTGRPYIRSITGGKDKSKENLQNGMSHAFVVQFYSIEDRDYYVDHDPAHQAFKNVAKGAVERAQVLDFQEGVFI